MQSVVQTPALEQGALAAGNMKGSLTLFTGCTAHILMTQS